MSQLSEFSCKIRKAEEGLTEYIPIIFEESCFCSIKCYLHSIHIDYRFKSEGQCDNFENFLKKATQQCFQLELLFQDSKLGLQNFVNGYVDSLREVQLRYQKKLLNLQDSIPTDKKQILLQNIMKIPIVQTNKISQFYQGDAKSNNEELIQVINQVGGSLCIIWYLFLDNYKLYSKILNNMEGEYQDKIAQRLTNIIVRQRFLTNDFAQNLDLDILQNRDESSKLIRENNRTQVNFFMNVEDQCMFGQPERQPIFFETTLQKPSKTEQTNEIKQQFIFNNIKSNIPQQQQKHLVVFVHGYQGNSYDFRLWKCYFQVKFPNHTFLSSQCNENDTELDIWLLGQNLANEVKQCIQDKLIYNYQFKISFIGHSLGGIIIRAALNHLDQYEKNMYTYVSLASPHLGLGAQYSKIVETGIWFMKKLKKGGQSLEQLTMCDSEKLSSTLIWKLSQSKKLNSFKNILIAYSYQDMYVPYQSACIMKIKKGYLDSIQKCENHNQLIQNLMCNYTNDRLIKVDVSFPLHKKSLDTMIGRTAHIEFLDNGLFIKMFLDSFFQYFE